MRLPPLSVDCATGLVTLLVHNTSSFAALTPANGLTVPLRSVPPMLGHGG